MHSHLARSNHRRTLLAATAAIAWLLAACAGAQALTVSPSGSYVTTGAGSVRFTLTSNRQTITCVDSQKEMTLASNGTGSIAVGDAMYASCTNPLLGAVTLTQRSAWSVTTTLAAGRVSQTFGIPASGLELRAANCTFWLEGQFVKSKSVSSLPALVDDGVTSSSALRVSRNNSGALCSIAPANLAGTYTADLVFATPMTVSG